MSKHSIQIEENAYQRLKEYCDINNLKIGPYVTSLILRGLNQDMYGDAPFLKSSRKREGTTFLSANALSDILNSRNDIDVNKKTETITKVEEVSQEIKEEIKENKIKMTDDLATEVKPVVRRRKLK